METLDRAGIRPKTFCKIVLVLVVLTWLAMPTLASRTARTRPRPVRQSKPVRTIQTPSGGSPSFRQSLVVPTLDSSWPRGKNIIWCSSFQLAWNEIRDNVIGAPLQVGGAAELAAQLNAAEQSSSDLDPNSFYVAGGRIEDGIIDKIKKDMKVRFPSHVLADFKDYGGGILAYSYLAANVPFTHPFRQSENGLAFRDSRGSKTQVEAFGLWEAFLPEYAKIREQVEILYCDEPEGRDSRAPMKEFAIDLRKSSQPYQVVLAVVEPNDSLEQTLHHVRIRTEESRSRDNYDRRSRLQEMDILCVPEMSWEIEHHFRELIGRMLKNVDMPIVEAMQTIKFKLDRSGAAVESEARLAAAAIPHVFLVDRPFLLYMEKRGVEHPFFVMWVDNAELLTRRR